MRNYEEIDRISSCHREYTILLIIKFSIEEGEGTFAPQRWMQDDDERNDSAER
jgi:hypothetical protein